MRKRSVILLLPFAFSGCSVRDVLEPVICTAQFAPAIIVEIRDARTNAPLAAEARGVVRDGAYVDSLRPAEAESGDPASLFSRQAAGERKGTYSIEVQRAGYRTWTTAGVKVDADRCHVLTRRVRADMEPLG
jgi:hypothetical protein